MSDKDSEPTDLKRISLQASEKFSSEPASQQLESQFGYKYCTKFVLQAGYTDDETKGKRCLCGELKVNHSHFASNIEQDTTAWSTSNIVYVRPTNAHGTIHFQESGIDLQQTSQYIRISDTDSPEDVLNYLSEMWHFLEPKRPRMCISVACEPTDVQIVESNRQKIFEGLIKLSLPTCALLIANGVNTGVGKIIGKVQQRTHLLQLATSQDAPPIRCLGVLPWGQVHHSPSLVNQSTGDQVNYNCNAADGSGVMYTLSPDYSHFLFIDDGFHYDHEHRTFNEFAVKIEQRISLPTLEGGWAIPTVLVVIGGDHVTIAAVTERIKLGIPVVILKGSGGICDTMETFISFCRQNRVSSGSDDGEDALIQLLQYSLGEYDEQLLAQTATNCREIERNESLLTFCDLDANDGLDVVLEALLHISKDTMTSLSLTLDWNRTDLAKSVFMSAKTPPSQRDLEFLFTEAILRENHEMLKVILEQKFNLQQYLNVEVLQYLYQAAANRKSFERSLSAFKIKVNKNTRQHCIKHYGSMDLTIPQQCPSYECQPIVQLDDPHEKKSVSNSGSNIQLYHVNRLMKNLIGHFDCVYYELTSTTPSRELGQMRFQNPFQELFLWAALFQKHELALFFWHRSTDGIFLAIVGTCLARRHAALTTVSETLLKEELSANADEFENLAVQMVNHSAAIYPDIKTALPFPTKRTWNCKDVVWLGLIGSCRRFLSVLEIQDCVHSEWTSDVDASPFIFPLGLFIPPLLFVKSLFRFEERPGRLAVDHQSTSDSNEPVDPGEVIIKEISPKKKLTQVYTSPRAKYTLNLLSYMALTIFAAYTAIYHIGPAPFSIPEVILCVFLIALSLDGLLLVLRLWRSCGCYLAGFFFSLPVVWIEVLSSLQILICICLRIALGPDSLTVNGFIAALVLWLFLRFFVFFVSNQVLGPYLITIFRMFAVAITFQAVILTILIPSGIVQQALLYPSRTELTWQAIKDVVFFNYYRLFAFMQLEEISGEKDGCFSNSTDPDCPTANFFVPVVLSVYALIATIFLINFLIAIFNDVIADVKAAAIEIWKYDILLQLNEYSARFILPPPFTFIEGSLRFLSRIKGKLSSGSRDSTDRFSDDPAAEVDKKMTARQQAFGAIETLARIALLQSEDQVVKNSILTRQERMETTTKGLLKSVKETSCFVAKAVNKLHGSLQRPAAKDPFAADSFDYEQEDFDDFALSDATTAEPLPSIAELKQGLTDLQSQISKLTQILLNSVRATAAQQKEA
uniref:Transient receptor potential cation channel subfamily M member 2 n=1 Tax=Schistocephalus solidus TaxID=70667 RepID=A0A0X3Q5K9_SCHSO